MTYWQGVTEFGICGDCAVDVLPKMAADAACMSIPYTLDGQASRQIRDRFEPRILAAFWKSVAFNLSAKVFAITMSSNIKRLLPLRASKTKQPAQRGK